MDAADADTLPAPPPPVRAVRGAVLPPGTQIGRYVLIEKLGAGGMGIVYRARDPRLDRDVALKLVIATVDVDSAQERLEREAQAMAKLHHPNVVTVHDIGTHEGQLFIAMELCKESLGAWLRKQQPWNEVTARFIAAGRGLAAAHQIGLVHRDFKPDNVMLAHDGTVKVSDFGLVVSVVPGAGSSQGIEGTPAYMAPEQLAGDDVDARADQFSFAVALWEGVCGGRPFQPISTEDAVTGMLQVIRARRRMRSTASVVPLRVIRILERALEPEPADRWPTLDAMLAALESATRSRRRRWLLACAMVAVAAITATVVVMTRRPVADLEVQLPKIKSAVPALYAVAARLTEDPDRASRLFMDAYRAGGGAALLFEAAKRSFDRGDCKRTIQALETLRTAIEGGAPYPSEMKDAVIEMRAECMMPYRVAQDVPELEKIADRYFFDGDLDGVIQALKRARALTLDPGDRARFMLRIGDYAKRLGACDTAREAYEVYLKEERRGGAEMDKVIRQRGVDCVPSED